MYLRVWCIVHHGAYICSCYLMPIILHTRKLKNKEITKLVEGRGEFAHSGLSILRLYLDQTPSPKHLVLLFCRMVANLRVTLGVPSHRSPPPLLSPTPELSVQFSLVQSLSRVWLFATPWIAARQASLSITNSRSSPRLTSMESVMPSSRLLLCHPLLLLPLNFSSHNWHRTLWKFKVYNVFMHVYICDTLINLIHVCIHCGMITTIILVNTSILHVVTFFVVLVGETTKIYSLSILQQSIINYSHHAAH